ncbi:hypothetical protein [Empedobacter brevis]|uniref:hypothetical protein n=1 Tax=Empedobacter brevis TaxID=247 RepID=UPI0028A11C92|nr:hypothetical protein [Empedobacter brevis]
MTEFQKGDVVQLKTTHSGAQFQFVVSEIIGDELKVIWFNTDLKEFKRDVLPKSVFKKLS